MYSKGYVTAIDTSFDMKPHEAGTTNMSCFSSRDSRVAVSDLLTVLRSAY